MLFKILNIAIINLYTSFTINSAYRLSTTIAVIIVVIAIIVNNIVGIMFKYCYCRTDGHDPLTVRRAGNCFRRTTFRDSTQTWFRCRRLSDISNVSDGSRTNNDPNRILHGSIRSWSAQSMITNQSCTSIYNNDSIAM